MYLEHFGLAVNPFSLSPKLDFLYKSEAFEESMAHLVYGVDNSEAIVMITGAIGTGKTTALHSFLTNLGPNFHSALVTNTQMSAIELLKLILEDLEIQFFVGCDKSDLLILFKEFLLRASLSGRRVIIVIDEAQNLSAEVLEEVRLLTNLGQGDTQPVQIILVGQPELERIVNQKGLAQLRQRIRVHYRLDPLSREEVEGYLVHRMGVAGCSRPVFKPKAIDLIYEFSDGIPRLVNSMAGNALLSAFVAGREHVAPGDVDEPEGVFLPVTRREPAQPEPSSDLHFANKKTEPKRARPEPVPEKTRLRGRNRKKMPLVWLWVPAVAAVFAGLYFSGVLAGLFSPANDIEVGLNSGMPRADQAIDQPVESISRVESVPTDSVVSPVPSNSDTIPTRSVLVENDTMIIPSADEPEAENNIVERDQPTPVLATEMYFVHIASFQEKDRAAAYVEKLNGLGQPARWQHSEVFGETWYRVYLGPYSTEAQAGDAVSRLKDKEKIPYHMITRMTAILPE